MKLTSNTPMHALKQVPDPRKPSNGTLHDLREMLVIMICAILCDNNDVEEIVAWAKARRDWLSRFLVLKSGIPSEDTFLRLLRLIDPKQFERVFREWIRGVLPALDGTVAIDGKTVRAPARRAKVPFIGLVPSPPHLVWCSARKKYTRKATKSSPFQNTVFPEFAKP